MMLVAESRNFRFWDGDVNFFAHRSIVILPSLVDKKYRLRKALSSALSWSSNSYGSRGSAHGDVKQPGCGPPW